jgi:hypothetical protein
VDSSDVGGHQVRGALDTLEGALERFGHTSRQGGLADARHVFHEDMPTTQHRGHC